MSDPRFDTGDPALDAALAEDDAELATLGACGPTYHDLHVTTAEIERTSIFNLPFGLDVRCTRTTGWQLWSGSALLAGEYDDAGLRLDVAGHVVVDSLTSKESGE